MKRMGRWWWAVGFWALLGSSCEGMPGDPVVIEGAAPSSAGKQTVWLILKEEANLAPAGKMRDWRARGQMVFEQLTRTAALTQEPLTARLRSRGVEPETFWIVNAVRISAEPWLIRLASSLPEVAAVHPDRTISLPPGMEASEDPQPRAIGWGVEDIGAPAVWSHFGFRGDGIVVGNIDTGVDLDHPAVRRQYRGRQANGSLVHHYSWYDPARVCGRPSLFPCDNAGHGTHTIGIILGEDERDTRINRIGVAPRARWIAAKGCESGDCSLASLLRAGEWMLAPTDLDGANPRPDMRPHIINNSWSAGTGDDVFFERLVTAWVAAGIFPIFASGNDGPACSSADSPSDYPDSYAIAAHDSDGQIASFSSRGNTNLGGMKPNISAPGVNIRSSIPGGGYGVSNGTSMATPHVAGAVALLWSAAPSLVGDVAGTRALLDQTAIDTEDLSCGGTTQNNNVFGEGRLDIFAAVSRAPRGPTGILAGMVGAAAGDHSQVIASARVRAQGSADRTTPIEGEGAYDMVLPAGSYTVTASAFGFVSQAIAAVVVNGEERTAQNFTLEHAPTFVVRGLVRQTDGQPLAGARVTVVGTPLRPAITDSEGAYRIPGVPDGEYQVSANRGGCFGRASGELSVANGDAELELELPRRSDYHGYFCEPRRAGFIEASNELTFPGGWQPWLDSGR
jgi:subtilisin family serine protease